VPVIAVSPDTGRLDVGDTWVLAVELRDDVTDQLEDATLAAVVTRPDTSTSNPTPVKTSVGLWSASYVLNAPGWHTATLTASGALVGVATFRVEALEVGAVPTLAEVQDYLASSGPTTWTSAAVAGALAAELAAQGKACRIPAEYPPDLREALYRRVARNLAARAVKLGQWTAFDGGATVTKVPQKDPEVGRLEAPYRVFRVG
jgi:hypothetical protein